MKYKSLYFVISAILLVPGIIALAIWGLRPAIDFTGGTLLEVSVSEDFADKIDSEILESYAESQGIEVVSVQTSGERAYLLKAKAIDQLANSNFQSYVASRSGAATTSAVLTEKRFETLGPTLGAETLHKALAAISIAAVGILLFVWKQFKDKKYGICAILAMLHDSLLIFGLFAIFGRFFGAEVDTLFMTAVLTILSFSIHDTIVVYDRIRESLRKLPGENFERIVDKAVNETMGRSINNSMTIIFMLFALALLGGETTKWFVVALLIGTVSGTYSSPFVAAPLLVVWEKWFGRRA
jgi:preprotein translocase subunit SecF